MYLEQNEQNTNNGCRMKHRKKKGQNLTINVYHIEVVWEFIYISNIPSKLRKKNLRGKAKNT